MSMNHPQPPPPMMTANGAYFPDTSAHAQDPSVALGGLAAAGTLHGADDSVNLTPSKRRGRPKGQKDKNPYDEAGRKKKRGRPKGKKDGPRSLDAPRRGRPPKAKDDTTTSTRRATSTAAAAGTGGAVAGAKKPRGRKPRRAAEPPQEADVQGMGLVSNNDMNAYFDLQSLNPEAAQELMDFIGVHTQQAAQQPQQEQLQQPMQSLQTQQQTPGLGGSSSRRNVTLQTYLEQKFGATLQEWLSVAEPQLSEIRRLLQESKQQREAQQQQQLGQDGQQGHHGDGTGQNKDTPVPPLSLNGA